MRAGDFDTAWAINDIDLRLDCSVGPPKHVGARHFQRIWRGEDLTGKNVLVRCYHGLGDTIQFIRFAKPLRQIARRVTVWVQPELVSMIAQVEGVDHAMPLHDGTPDLDFDADIEIMELAHALRATTDMISGCVPYLSPVRKRIKRLRTSKYSVGLVWEAGSWDQRRCVPLGALARLKAIPNIQLFSLQQGPARSRRQS